MGYEDLMGATLNKYDYSCRNYRGPGDGYVVADSGEVQLASGGEGVAYDTFTISANIQPMPARKRRDQGEGSDTEDRIAIYMDPNTDGTWQPLRTASEAGGLPATRVTYNGGTYEVQLTNPSWKHGLLAHLYAEATLLIQEGITKISDTSGGFTW